MSEKKILVADDSLTIQKVIRLALANEGYEIQALSDGSEAIEQISLFRPDAVLIDVSLPGKTAFELKRAINGISDLSHVCFVLMSSAFEQVDETEANELHFDGRLVKPFDPAHLRQVLKDVLAKADAKRPETRIELNQPDESPFSDDLWNKNEQGSGGESDIKKLTESTIKMSGLDNFQWNINETARLPDFEPTQDRDPVIMPPPRMLERDESPLDFSPQQEERPAPPVQIEAHESRALPISNEEMERLIRDQLKETLERMTKQLLPNIAERIIKEEINRLLSDPP